MHQTVGNILRTLLHQQAPYNEIHAAQLVDSALATTMHAIRASIHRTLQVTPGALVFQRDMFLDIPLLADLINIRDRRQVIIDENLRRQNLRRHFHDYHIGQQILLLTPNPATLADRATGPFTIHQVHVNGTLTIWRTPHILERVNIRRARPYQV
jgi:hypothetical protein